ncbi:MAG: hypothetical protein K9M57_11200 [Phycisphaerae bacterium]|nr:hypothetical protein [Phycisphaerae bacterium]
MNREYVDEDNLIKFKEQLLKTGDLLEKRAFLIEPNHYDARANILSHFMNFQVGKVTLVELKLVQGRIRNFDTEQIRQQIEQNRQQRKALLTCVSQMRDCLRSQIRG